MRGTTLLRASVLPKLWSRAQLTDRHYHSGVTTGVSAYDRAVTIRALANPATTPEELVRPGHIFPLRYTPGGVLTRGGHTEASVDLARWAGLQVTTATLELH